ncbi:hypothetical protein [Vibrio aestuarianus]|uniref:hypothetical protein n=1 Tax=Vibrio aestuarianus TaxID=28171 RepID=UPI00237CE494|nr:hypothetical protein [Vibrio aestuarianus]MDE1231354.1 hypothetical protein [Vibrio aestuarianus]MDE1330303.1 hypothetical protein [Vibrio aestuarianus]
MKKPSKQWKDFAQLIDIVNIRIMKQQMKLEKLRRELRDLEQTITEQWQEINNTQDRLRSLNVINENNSITRMFQRRESIKSKIESIFFDVSVASQNAEDLALQIMVTEKEKQQLEKRKDALVELQVQLMGEKN